jgi:hypothetical protein
VERDSGGERWGRRKARGQEGSHQQQGRRTLEHHHESPPQECRWKKAFCTISSAMSRMMIFSAFAVPRSLRTSRMKRDSSL